MARDVILACDFPDARATVSFLQQFKGQKPFVKIGMELFYGAGPSIVHTLKEMGHKIFLDLKLHDIPNTVKKAMRVLSGLEIDLCNVHAAGTIAMMEAALEGLTAPDGKRPQLIAVTQLTSTSSAQLHDELGIQDSMEETVIRYARNAKAAGLDGVVCSPLETRGIKEACGDSFLAVTPGIRYPSDDKGDQTRVTSPADAKRLGSDYIVVGRPITAAPDPVAAYERVLKDFL